MNEIEIGEPKRVIIVEPAEEPFVPKRREQQLPKPERKADPVKTPEPKRVPA